MRIALCVDNRNGFSFNHRRLSRDRAQQENLMALCAGEPLWLASCSLPCSVGLETKSGFLRRFQRPLTVSSFSRTVCRLRSGCRRSSSTAGTGTIQRTFISPGIYPYSPWRRLQSFQETPIQSSPETSMCEKREDHDKTKKSEKIKSSQAMALLLLALVGSALYRYAVPASTASIQDIPAYNGSPYVTISDNVPTFTKQDWTTDSYEIYGALDALGRCTRAEACIGPDLMPSEDRGIYSGCDPHRMGAGILRLYQRSILIQPLSPDRLSADRGKCQCVQPDHWYPLFECGGNAPL